MAESHVVESVTGPELVCENYLDRSWPVSIFAISLLERESSDLAM